MKKIQVQKEALCYWIIGLSAAGKTTVASSLMSLVKENGFPVVLLDGDVMRGVLKGNVSNSEEIFHPGYRYSPPAYKLIDREDSAVSAIGLFEDSHFSHPTYPEPIHNVIPAHGEAAW